jgi:hypothetical protein
VHAAVFECRLHADVEPGHGQVGLLLGNDVIGQLEYDAQPFQEFVGGVHRGGLVVAAGQEHRHAAQVDSLEHEAVGLQPGEAGELLLLGRGGQGVGLRAAQHDQRPCGRRLVGRDDGQLGSGELLEMPLELAGEPAGKLAGIGADHDRRLGLAALGQQRLLGRRRCRRHQRDRRADQQVTPTDS